MLTVHPAIVKTIIGARRLSQLEDNVKALAVHLGADDLKHLDTLTKPTFGFPQSMQPMFPAIHNGGTSVSGVRTEPSSFVMLRGEKPY